MFFLPVCSVLIVYEATNSNQIEQRIILFNYFDNTSLAYLKPLLISIYAILLMYLCIFCITMESLYLIIMCHGISKFKVVSEILKNNEITQIDELSDSTEICKNNYYHCLPCIIKNHVECIK